nr:hypothetical protein GCM10020093_078050 [Planobispora longispora]
MALSAVIGRYFQPSADFAGIFDTAAGQTSATGRIEAPGALTADGDGVGFRVDDADFSGVAVAVAVASARIGPSPPPWGRPPRHRRAAADHRDHRGDREDRLHPPACAPRAAPLHRAEQAPHRLGRGVRRAHERADEIRLAPVVHRPRLAPRTIRRSRHIPVPVHRL